MTDNGVVGGPITTGTQVAAPAVAAFQPADPGAGITWRQWMNDPGCSSSGSVVTVAADLTVDARPCTTVKLPQLTVRLRGDLTIHADSLDTLGGTAFVSDDGLPHTVEVIATGAVKFSAQSTTDTLIGLAVHTPGLVTVLGPSDLTATIDSGAFTSSGAVTLR